MLSYSLSEDTVKAIQEDTQLSKEELFNLSVSDEIKMAEAVTGRHLDYSRDQSSDLTNRGNVYINEGYFMTSEELDFELTQLTSEILDTMHDTNI